MNDALRLKLKERFDRFQAELWTPYHSDPPKYLYHFSPPRGICGILESKEIWVSDIQRLNDRREAICMLGVFGPLLQRKSVPESAKKRFREAENLWRMGERWFGYVASFCATKNVDSQWENYADRGTGCAIGIDLEALFAKSSGGKQFALLRLLYDEREQLAKAEATIDHAIHLSRELEIPKRELDHFWISAALDSLMPCGLRFKDPQYQREQEWRVLMLRPDLNTASERTLPDGHQTHYLRLPLDGSIVKSILRGPNCACTTENLRRLLENSGLAGEIEICDSE